MSETLAQVSPTEINSHEIKSTPKKINFPLGQPLTQLPTKSTAILQGAYLHTTP